MSTFPETEGTFTETPPFAFIRNVKWPPRLQLKVNIIMFMISDVYHPALCGKSDIFVEYHGQPTPQSMSRNEWGMYPIEKSDWTVQHIPEDGDVNGKPPKNRGPVPELVGLPDRQNWPDTEKEFSYGQFEHSANGLEEGFFGDHHCEGARGDCSIGGKKPENSKFIKAKTVEVWAHGDSSSPAGCVGIGYDMELMGFTSGVPITDRFFNMPFNYGDKYAEVNLDFSKTIVRAKTRNSSGITLTLDYGIAGAAFVFGYTGSTFKTVGVGFTPQFFFPPVDGITGGSKSMWYDLYLDDQIRRFYGYQGALNFREFDPYFPGFLAFTLLFRDKKFLEEQEAKEKKQE